MHNALFSFLNHGTLSLMIDILRKLVPDSLLNWYHFAWAFLGALLYRFPSKNLVVIGVTGTNGKSTTVDMITRIFKEAGLGTASMSSCPPF